MTNESLPLGTAEELRETVRSKYAERAQAVLDAACCEPECCTDEAAVVAAVESACCSTSCCTDAGDASQITSNLYSGDEVAVLPGDAVKASLGCGNPTALASLEPGEKVLDLGSGGGIDVLLSARRVGPEGFAYGLDMTDEMLALAERNRATAGLSNVKFLKGHIEDIPLPNDEVDVLISNCVINLSADKKQVIREAFRVLKPGGRFAVSDVVVQGELPSDLRKDMEAWVGCVAGALEEGEYRRNLAAAGFSDIDVEVTRVYDTRALAETKGADWNEPEFQRFEASGGRVVSAFVRARKPGA
ncbi:MAG: arsenite methyltransferase [Chloroflexota bacterium]